MLALAFGLSAPPPALAAPAQPRVTIAMVPPGTEVGEIAEAVPGISPGVLSSGLGAVPASQTYLDIGQGSRLFSSLYPRALPPLVVRGNRVRGSRWRAVIERAADAPADIEPGLLASTLADGGISIAASPLAGSSGLIAADRDGRVARASHCEPGRCPGVTVASVELSQLAALGRRLDENPEDLLIALERPPPERDLLAVGIAGPGFGDGDLTSATTRMDGYVTSTDLMPTILDRYGIEVPDGVLGREIETTGGTPDAAGVAAREERLAQVGSRRWEVLAVNLIIWLAAVALAVAIGRRRGAAIALPLLGVTVTYVPALLLLGAALQPSELIERLIVGVGAPLAAAGSLLVLRGRLGERAAYGAFALGAAISVGATAIDVLAGSPLTAISLIGPNPGAGVRFFGIGNELEATIAALLMLGTGAAVSALRPGNPGRAVALATAFGTLLAVLAFAPGRFGADVGAAITLPAGAAAVAIAALGLTRRRALLVAAAPAVALIALVALDLVFGGDAHLSRSVLAAGGFDELGDVLERRITLGARSFPRYLDSPFFVAVLALIAAGVLFRARIAAWMADHPAARAGVVGAVAATVVGTLANDSAALLLMVGTAFTVAFCGLAWGAGPGSPPARGRANAAPAARVPGQ